MLLLYWLLQWTWGIVQNVAGGLLTLLLRRCPHFRYRGAIFTRWSFGGSMGLGMFIFLSRSFTDAPESVRAWEACILVHEYGHTVQSAILGPLYLLVIGLPSFVWANVPALRRMREKRHISYSSMYQERWANRLGARVTGESAPEESDL